MSDARARHDDILGPDEAVSSKWELPPIDLDDGESFGPRRRPRPGRADPGGWRPGMPTGHQAWEVYRYRHRDYGDQA